MRGMVWECGIFLESFHFCLLAEVSYYLSLFIEGCSLKELIYMCVFYFMIVSLIIVMTLRALCGNLL